MVTHELPSNSHDYQRAMTLHGLYALRGFDYQVTVTLDILLRHYGSATDGAVLARPEGDDDLVLKGIRGHSNGLVYVQIKKPRESDNGQRTNSAWTLADIARDLLPGTLARLEQPQDVQTWVLGDSVDPEALKLFEAARSSPATESAPYLSLLHLLARNQSNLPNAARPRFARREKDQAKTRLERWRPALGPERDPDKVLAQVADAFIAEALTEEVSQEKCDEYRQILTATHEKLPDVLARTTVLCTYGSEATIRERVRQELAEQYGLDLDVVAHALVRNLRGFVQDIATQPNRWFDREEFDLELRSVWPRMNLVAEPPLLGSLDLQRRPVVDTLLSSASLGALEVTGVSGAGKTKLASAVLAHVRGTRPEVHALYLEVRPEHSVRDVLAGAAFHLRRFGVKEPFALATQHRASDEHALRALAKCLCEHALPTLLLLDLVQGTCSDAFARELAIFVEELQAPVSLVAFGQESALRGMSGLERVARGLPPAIDLPGFNFDEFRELTQRLHTVAPDREELWSIFQAATGGRSAGLYARLAEALAQCPSLERMRALVSLPRDQALAEADRARYLDIPAELREATDRILCFALPFRRDEAEVIFPTARIADGIRELLQRGLLRMHDTDLLEMHETVRAGLEQLTPVATRADTHSKLASHYEQRANPIAAVHHLEQAGRTTDAHRIARDAFLAGTQRFALGPYIAKHKLVSASEVVDELLRDPLPEHVHLVPDLLEAFHDTRAADVLFAAVAANGERFEKNHGWAWLMTDAILASDPTRIEALVDFCLSRLVQGETDVFDYVVHGARNRSPTVSPSLLATFAKQSDDIKVRLVPILLLDARREIMGPVLSFVARYGGRDSGNGRRDWQWGSALGTPLRLRQATHVRELLGALPLPETSQTIISKGVLFGRLEAWLWKERRAIHGDCVAILQSDETDEVVLENALRMLVFLGDDRAIRLAERYTPRRSRLGNLAAFVPALFPSTANSSVHRDRLLDTARDINERLGDLSVLLHMGADMSELLATLTRLEPDKRKLWSWVFVTYVLHRPWPDGIPVFEEMLEEPASDDDQQLFGPIVLKFGELPGEQVTDFLIRQLGHASPMVRFFASQALLSRRSRRAMSPLVALAETESNPTIARQMLASAVASGPTSIRSFDKVWPQRSDSEIWRLVLANRLRSDGEAGRLIATAADPSQRWELRRMAVLAAGKLTFDRALAAIATPLLAERSPLTLDTHPSLETHALVADLLGEEAQGLRPRFVAGRTRFVGLLRDIINDAGKQQLGLLPGEVAATWLYERLEFHDWAQNPEAHVKVINELHVPIVQAAVLRGLRMTGNYALLEETIKTSDSVWLVSRALIEATKARRLTAEEHARIKQLVDSNPIGANYCPQNILKHTTPSSEQRIAPEPSRVQPASRTLTFAEVENLLRGGGNLDSAPIVVSGLSRDQLILLADELAPERDYPSRWVPSQPSLGFTATGFTVHGSRLESIPGNRELREKLRPALAAANRHGVTISWHVELLRGNSSWSGGHASEQYVASLLRCLGAQGDPQRLYDELAANGDLLFPLLDDVHRISPMRPLIDARAIPFVVRYVNSGTDTLFESMCWIASHIDSPDVDPALEALFRRWVHRFNLSTSGTASAQSFPFWHAFSFLSKHPRFHAIPNVDLRLTALLRHQMAWFHKRDVVDTLSKSPRSYIFHETMLFTAAPFEHFSHDEVDRLEEYAESLFGTVTD
jgi:hypothetical protein